jgi:hypothetical protein
MLYRPAFGRALEQFLALRKAIGLLTGELCLVFEVTDELADPIALVRYDGTGECCPLREREQGRPAEPRYRSTVGRI